uniref:TSC22 domain family protein 3 n=1 Tax=Callithrix jacchus TaxID=9483 RepID=A0A8I3W761_CALJA
MAQSKIDCRSPVGLDCCNCCLDLAHRSGLQRGSSGENNNPGSSTVTNFRQLQEKLVFENLNTDKLNSIMRQDSLEPVLRDPCYLINEGICNRNIDQTMLSILLFFHSASGASVVAIDNKIEQAMDLVKNHLMYAVREEVEVLKEQIRELVEKNSQLERENTLLKTLASPEQLEKFQSRLIPEEPLNLFYLVLSSLFLAPQASSHEENFTPSIAGAKRCPKDMATWVHSSDRPLTRAGLWSLSCMGPSNPKPVSL